MNYYLAEGCQNTFVLFDCLEIKSLDEEFLQKAHKCLEKEQRDDALILIEGNLKEGEFSARMVVLGQDNTLGEFCGNGARACAAYLFEKYPLIQKFFLITKHGKHPLERHEEGFYSITLPPACFELNQQFITDPERFKKDYSLCYVEMIEPHLVFEGKMSDEELLSLGRELNQQKDLFPHGINVNAWHLIDDENLYVKTYERGVQRLTQSCGTGSMSCAAAQRKHSNLRVTTPGGILEINVQEKGIKLKGPASYI